MKIEMAKPTVNKIAPFDASVDKTFSFSWAGSQPYANRLIIYNADSMKPIYDRKISTFPHTHTLPASTLTNGKKWAAQFQTFDVDDTASELSDKSYFQTLKTPLFYFYGLENGQILQSAFYDAQIYYLQEDYEDIQSFKFYLYDGTKTLLSESETMYDSTKIRYQYKGLDNHTVYYFRCHGMTVNGMEIDTGYIQIYTDYRRPGKYSIIYAENDPLHGYIKYHTNIVVIQYNGSKAFHFENGMIDLRGDNEGIYYDKGFVIDGDFTLKLRGMYLNQTATILELRNTKYSIIVSSYLYEDGTTRFKLDVPNGLGHYILYSDAIAFNPTDMVCVWIRKVNDIYQLEIIADPDYVDTENIWYGQQMPPTPDVYDIWVDAPNLFTYPVNKDDMATYYSDEEPPDADINDIWN